MTTLIVRQGLRSALEAYPNIEAVGEANDGEWAIVELRDAQTNRRGDGH